MRAEGSVSGFDLLWNSDARAGCSRGCRGQQECWLGRWGGSPRCVLVLGDRYLQDEFATNSSSTGSMSSAIDPPADSPARFLDKDVEMSDAASEVEFRLRYMGVPNMRMADVTTCQRISKGPLMELLKHVRHLPGLPTAWASREISRPWANSRRSQERGGTPRSRSPLCRIDSRAGVLRAGHRLQPVQVSGSMQIWIPWTRPRSPLVRARCRWRPAPVRKGPR